LGIAWLADSSSSEYKLELIYKETAVCIDTSYQAEATVGDWCGRAEAVFERPLYD